MEEVWKDIRGYEGHYQVSNHGRVRSLNRKTIHVQTNQYCEYKVERELKGKVLSPRKLPAGYLRVQLYDVDFYVHRLVCANFIRPLEPKEEINHIDGNKANNMLWNLEIVSRIENQNHAVDIGLNKTVEKALPVRVNGVPYNSIGEASRSTGIPVQALCKRLKDPLVKPYKHFSTIERM